jgi:hypothetical protein
MTTNLLMPKMMPILSNICNMFEKISAFHFSQVEIYEITNSGTDQGQRWINLKSVFKQIDLLTLFLGVRTPRVSNRLDNAYGYT